MPLFYEKRLSSPLGELQLISSGAALRALRMEGQPPFPEPLLPGEERPELRQGALWLSRYFAGERPEARLLPLQLGGTELQRTLWALLLALPWGETLSYGGLAREAASRLGRERLSPRGVGAALGRNPLLIFVPCHRVLGADGSLRGYAGGVERQRFLLELEGIKIRSGSCGSGNRGI